MNIVAIKSLYVYYVTIFFMLFCERSTGKHAVEPWPGTCRFLGAEFILRDWRMIFPEAIDEPAPRGKTRRMRAVLFDATPPGNDACRQGADALRRALSDCGAMPGSEIAVYATA